MAAALPLSDDGLCLCAANDETAGNTWTQTDCTQGGSH